MYDGSVYRVFTGVIVRVVPNAAHFEFHFVPLNEKRDALVRDEKNEPLVWVIQMESAGEALKLNPSATSPHLATALSLLAQGKTAEAADRPAKARTDRNPAGR
jgi:hypothetical protein